MERIFVWLGAWAFGFSFFFSSSITFSFASRAGTLLSTFLFFLSGRWTQCHKEETKKKQPAHAQLKGEFWSWKYRRVPAGELLLLETLCERMVAIQPSTSTDANFLKSKNKTKELQRDTWYSLLKKSSDFWCSEIQPTFSLCALAQLLH